MTLFDRLWRWLAGHCSLIGRAGVAACLWRLFVLSRREIVADASPLHRFGDRCWRRMRRELGVRVGAAPREYLLRLFLLPSPAAMAEQARREADRIRRRQRAAPPGLLRRCGQLARRPVVWLRALLWPYFDRLERRLAGLDYPALAQRFETRAALFMRLHPLLRGSLLFCVPFLFALAATTPLSWAEQLVFLGVMWLFAMLVRRLPGTLPTLILMGLALVASLRYVWWRLLFTLDLDSTTEVLLGTVLLGAEAYTWLILLLGFVQTLWPLGRKPAPLPADPASWPSVDVYIPTYNEPLAIVRTTVLAALGIDWPRDRLKIYLLDDGRREEFRAFADQVGVGYLTRPDNAHAKAGNLNRALSRTDGEFIAIFDCDHIPTRSFLQISMGWFLKDPKCALMQTPHHFFSPDPFERNLGTYRAVPNEGRLFYGLVQDGNDFWNATFFCGSCAVIRRAPLLEIGGIAVETVTEDAHTALKLQRRGYNTAYLNIPQAAGLATESLSSHVGQRIRWARGMAQIFRIDNPLLGKGLGFFQRLCYANAMLHFFFGIPRLIFLAAPLAYLLFEQHIINAQAAMIALYVLPHILHASLANSRLQGRYRHSFWAELYETVLAWYVMRPTTVAFFQPAHGKFNVTAKGGLVEKDYIDWGISLPYLIFLAFNVLGFGLGVVRLFWWNSYEPGTVVLNLIWCFYNLVILGAAMAAASEARQVRLAHRVRMRIAATLYLPDGRTLPCETEDFSLGGLGLRLFHGEALAPGTRVWAALHRGQQEYAFAADVLICRDDRLGIRFLALSTEDEARLIQCTFARADAWTGWDEQMPADRPLASLRELLLLGLQGYRGLFNHLLTRPALRWLRRLRSNPVWDRGQG